MDRGVYWILDSVIDSTKPIHWLHPSNSNLAIAVSRKHHKISHDQLISTLINMFHQGYLEIHDEFDERSLFSITSAESNVLKALSGDILLHYAITTKGSEIWERLSHPRWQQYSTIDGSENVSIAGGNEYLVKRLLHLYPITIDEHVMVIKDSIEWSVETPWRATYWKTLPRGYRVQFQTQPRERAIEPLPDVSYYHEWCQLLQWYTPYSD